MCSSPGGPRAPPTEEGLRGDPVGDKGSEDKDEKALPTKHRLCQQGGQRVSTDLSTLGTQPEGVPSWRPAPFDAKAELL